MYSLPVIPLMLIPLIARWQSPSTRATQARSMPRMSIFGFDGGRIVGRASTRYDTEL